jgi:hypothetical protein
MAFDHAPRVAIWMDGYGKRRVHIVIDLREVDHHRPSADETARDETARLDPWHGYNSHRPNGY